MYNPTCLITGKKDNLRMYSIRDENENMIGWVFIHESIEVDKVSIPVDVISSLKKINEGK